MLNDIIKRLIELNEKGNLNEIIEDLEELQDILSIFKFELGNLIE